MLHHPLDPLQCDVLIQGGGPAGSAAAIRLARAGAAVAMVERSHYRADRVGETLPPTAGPLLAELGAGQLLRAPDHLPTPGNVSVWGSDLAAENEFIFSPYGTGWHLDRRGFDDSLAQLACEAGTALLRGSRVVRQVPSSQGWQVLVEGATGRRQVLARWLIDATGRRAAVARSQGARRIAYDRLAGLVGLFDAAPGDPRPAAPPTNHPQTPDDPRTIVEATCLGWWYSALLPRGRGIAVFFTDLDLHRSTPQGRHALWRRELAASRRTLERFARWRQPGTLQMVPASSSLLCPLAGRGWLAVGDAACTLDPLSSQGICWALRSGLAAADALLQSEVSQALARYAGGLAERFFAYLGTRRDFYAAERRWPDSEFWRRQAGPWSPLEIGASRRLHRPDAAPVGLAPPQFSLTP